MFTNNISPVLFKIGIFEIRYYGIIYALGFIIAYLFLRHYIKKDKLEGIKVKQVDDLILYLLIGTVVGARLFNFVFYNPRVFWFDPIEILRIWEGGLSFHGGVIGAIISMSIFSRKYKVRFIDIIDALVIPGSLALALGRIANFTNQELYGTLSNLPWCVKFVAVDGLCRHPYQIYAAISHFILFGILLFIYARQNKEGASFWSFILFYGSFRFFTDFFREEIKFYGISMGQFLSLIMVIISLVVLIKRRKIKISRSLPLERV
ncbi:MAG: prolipoprotein diacylglyceryl transferase [Nanoarchaeota archaeon]|nr:prolipoprotein diacylglyceryl transferase [Nanoarchaeota archaeon]